MATLINRREVLKAGAAAGAALALGACTMTKRGQSHDITEPAQLILANGRIAMQDARGSFASALAIRDGRFTAVGDDKSILAHRGPNTQVIDVGKRTVI